MNPLTRDSMARMVAHSLPRNAFVNLGIGAPTLIADHLPDERGVILHSENGMLNLGPKPAPGEEDFDLINAGKSPVTIKTGGAFFDSSMAFAMMRGGHIDVAVLGAFQVSASGDLANWNIGNVDGAPPAIGGAVDLAVGAKQIWVMMDHVTKDNVPRLVRRCTLPLTAVGVVKRVFTNYCVMAVEPDGLRVEAVRQGLTPEALQAMTEAPLQFGCRLGVIREDGTMEPAGA
ncbi:3-oxoacid CoA-transferase subunit B [Achromobacter sp. ES-001]|uniref:3-oxoacid CoA-transferase subunit B n=1 Tax=Achromobacter sp. ES-001 TaxID=2860286 RepID=UPI001C63BC2F|nr:3-oxoacid CoA-transferase subunit B [Achromobacter sp. ES-001]QYJ23604.1 3-oxoacid CoA-transferase subunit B [Achromobacter sp. ES-001]